MQLKWPKIVHCAWLLFVPPSMTSCVKNCTTRETSKVFCPTKGNQYYFLSHQRKQVLIFCPTKKKKLSEKLSHHSQQVIKGALNLT